MGVAPRGTSGEPPDAPHNPKTCHYGRLFREPGQVMWYNQINGACRPRGDYRQRVHIPENLANAERRPLHHFLGSCLVELRNAAYRLKNLHLT